MPRSGKHETKTRIGGVRVWWIFSLQLAAATLHKEVVISKVEGAHGSSLAAVNRWGSYTDHHIARPCMLLLSSTSTWMMMRRDSLELALISLANHGLAFARGRQRTIRTTFSIWLRPFVIFTYQVFFIIRRMRLDYSHTIFSMALRIWQVISCIQRFRVATLFSLLYNTARLQCGYLPWMAPSRPVWQLVSLHRTWTMTGHLLGQFLSLDI